MRRSRIRSRPSKRRSPPIPIARASIRRPAASSRSPLPSTPHRPHPTRRCPRLSAASARKTEQLPAESSHLTPGASTGRARGSIRGNARSSPVSRNISAGCPIPRVTCKRFPSLVDRRLDLRIVPSPSESMNVSASRSTMIRSAWARSASRRADSSSGHPARSSSPAIRMSEKAPSATSGQAPSGGPARRPARERLLETAYGMFSTRGVRAVGVDEIIERAGVAKATLYRHFPSKDDLVLAFLEERERRWTVDWVEAEAQRTRLRARAAAARDLRSLRRVVSPRGLRRLRVHQRHARDGPPSCGRKRKRASSGEHSRDGSSACRGGRASRSALVRRLLAHTDEGIDRAGSRG